jgi:uncharacterized protein YecT (DUF1311 family)
VRAEADSGREQHKLVQALISDATLPMPFSQIQCADLRDWRGDRSHPEWKKVLRSLDDLVRSPAPKTGDEALAIRRRFRSSGRQSSLPPLVLGLALLLVVGAAFWLWREEGFMREMVRELRATPSRTSQALQPPAPTPPPAPARKRVRAPVRARTPTAASASAQAPPAATAPNPLAHPSFDCTKISTDIERFICSDVGVADAERRMAQVYNGVLARAADKPALQASQYAFLHRFLPDAHRRTERPADPQRIELDERVRPAVIGRRGGRGEAAAMTIPDFPVFEVRSRMAQP